MKDELKSQDIDKDDVLEHEERFSAIPTKVSPRHANTALVTVAFVGLVVLAAVVGMSVYKETSIANVISNEMPAVAQGIDRKIVPEPAPTLAKTTKPAPQQVAVTTTDPFAEEDLNAAFAGVDISNETKPNSTHTAASIDDIQKELFAVKVETEQKIEQSEEKSLDKDTIHKVNSAISALEQLNQQMSYNLNQIRSLEEYTREVSQTIAKLNNAINAMDGRILALNNTASNLSQDVGSVKDEIGTFRRALGDDPVAPQAAMQNNSQFSPGIENTYAVHAIIPGRAWLKNQTGQIITVTEGESFGDYGKVLVIDATNGVVLTNSGISFR